MAHSTKDVLITGALYFVTLITSTATDITIEEHTNSSKYGENWHWINFQWNLFERRNNER